MKLFYLANIRFPSERAHAAQIVNMCNAFQATGHDVQLIVSDRKTHTKETAEVYYGQKILFSTQKIKTFEVIHLSSFLFYLSGIIFALRSLRLLKTDEPCILYSRDEILLYIISFFKDPSMMVWESHQATSNFLTKSLIKRGVKLIVISEGIKEYYIAKGIPAEAMLVAHDGVDGSFFENVLSKKDARISLGLPLDKKVAMYIGGFDSWKGVETFFKASNESNDIIFATIGGSEEENKRFKIQYPKVVFLGRRPYKDLKNNQQAADVLVIPNTSKNLLSAEYTSPLKLFAYMTSHIPIVASNIPSIKHVLSTEEAFFFEADNPKSLFATIMEVINYSVVAYEKSQKAFEKSKKFTWRQRASEIIDFIY